MTTRWAAGIIGGLTLAIAAVAIGEESSHIPPRLRSGTATREDVVAFARTIDGGFEITEQDFDCDGEDEARLRDLFSPARPFAICVGPESATPFVPASAVERFVKEVAGYGPQGFQRVAPNEVSLNSDWNEWFETVSPWLARLWAETGLERFFTEGDGDPRTAWIFAAAGSKELELGDATVTHAIRLTRSGGPSRLGLVLLELPITLGSGDRRLSEVLFLATVVTANPWGEPDAVVALLAGTDAPGERRRILRLNRLTNMEDDPEVEIVLDEIAYAGAFQVIIDVARDGQATLTSLHADAWD